MVALIKKVYEKIGLDNFMIMPNHLNTEIAIINFYIQK
tara:strand:- start:421 stop:534 length:114 start_codon:yes stop_codon:yes gene_type:complete